MARRSGPRNRKNKKNNEGRWLKVLMLIFLTALMLSGGGVGLYHYMQIEKIDADFCYHRATQAKTAVFLDYSVNPDLSNAQRRDLVTALERAYAASPPNGKIMIFTTARDSAASIARPIFETCRPAETVVEQAAIGAPSQTAPRLAHIAGEARTLFWITLIKF